MREFPEFVRNPLNRIAASSQFTDDVEGWVFDGADGSQVALWQCRADRTSRPHTHPYDEYVVVIEGRCTLLMGDGRIVLSAGDEYVIRAGTEQTMQVEAGTRTLHVFGGRRARRAE